MPSFQQSGQCYPTANAAAQAAVSETLPQVATIGSNCVAILQPTGVSGGVQDTLATVLYSWYRVSGTCSVPPMFSKPYTVVPCQLIDHEDAVPLAWMVGGVWVAVVALLAIKKAFHR